MKKKKMMMTIIIIIIYMEIIQGIQNSKTRNMGIIIYSLTIYCKHK